MTSEMGWGTPTEDEVTAVSSRLSQEMIEALKLLYGAGPEDQGFRSALRHAMGTGGIKRSDGKKWGSSDEVRDVRWESADNPLKRLDGMLVVDKEGSTVDLSEPYLWYGPTYAPERHTISLAQGKGSVSLEWWRVTELIVGEVERKAQAWDEKDIIGGEVVLTTGERRKVQIYATLIAGKTNLGEFKIQLAKVARLTPRTPLHRERL